MDTIGSKKKQRFSSSDGVSDNVILQSCFLLDIGVGYPSLDGYRGSNGRFFGAMMTSYVKLSVNPGDEDYSTVAMINDLVCPLIDELFPSNAEHPIQVILDPGQHFMKLVFTICSRIYSVRVDADRRWNYFIAQGVRGFFKYVLFCGDTLLSVPLSIGDEIIPTDR